MAERRRACVVGTAGSWVRTPWDETSLYIVGLNDGYSLMDARSGMRFQRADEWVDIHPITDMWFRPKDKHEFKQHEIPVDKYVRPEGHLEWLQTQAKTIPVWLQDHPPAEWAPTRAARFPIEEITAHYGSYWASGPAYMLAHLYHRGFRSFMITGIHLSTQKEYLQQRPQFESMLGRFLGVNVAEHVDKGWRTYTGAECEVVLPVETPIYQHGWRYAYEHAPKPPDLAAQQRVEAIQRAVQAVAQQLIILPRWKNRTPLHREFTRLKAKLRDAQMQVRHDRILGGVL